VSISPVLELGKRLERDLVDRIMADRARVLSDAWELRGLAFDQAPKTGMVLEFGVFSGASLRFFAKRSDRPMNGFDTFEGLPRDDGIPVWKRHHDQRSFDLKGAMPSVPANVTLHKGLFEDTLPGFLAQHTDRAAFLHIDCDLYSSTKAVFDALGDRIVAGTVILFDEYFNYEGWQYGEYKAFQELIEARRLRYTILGVATTAANKLEFGRYARLAVRVDAVGDN
jgi:hypothetical protein